jgi:hypothetical protein
MREDEKKPLATVSEVSSGPIEPLSIGGDLPSALSEADYVAERLREGLAIPKDLLIAPKHTGPVKVVSMNREGDAYVALLECPIDSIDFHLKVSDGKPFEDPTDTKPCPICDFVLDPNGECVNHKCPNWIKE